MDWREHHLKAIAEAPWDDEQPRLVYADALDEHDEPEEAERQRQWVPSARWLNEFIDRYWSPEYEEYGYTRMTLQELMDSAQAENTEQYGWGSAFFRAVGRDLHGADELEPGEEDLFWQHMEVVTGKKFDKTHRDNFSWSCTC